LLYDSDTEGSKYSYLDRQIDSIKKAPKVEKP